MVTATNGTAVFRGLDSGTTYTVDFYISDVLAAPVTWSTSGLAGAGSLQFWKAPENVLLIDLSIITGPTVMVALQPTSNDGIIAGYMFRIANFLNSLATRASVGLGWGVGKNIGFIQR